MEENRLVRWPPNRAFRSRLMFWGHLPKLPPKSQGAGPGFSVPNPLPSEADRKQRGKRFKNDIFRG